MVLQKEIYQIVLALLRINLILRVSDDTLGCLSGDYQEILQICSLKKTKFFPEANNYFEILAYVFKWKLDHSFIYIFGNTLEWFILDDYQSHFKTQLDLRSK